MGLTKHQKVGAGLLLAIFVSGLLSILVGAPRLNPEITTTALVMMSIFHIMAIAVCVFYTHITLRQLLPADDYVRPTKLSAWQIGALLIPTTFVVGGIMIVWNHFSAGGFNTTQSHEMHGAQLWLLVIGCDILATIATVSLLIWHKWQTVASVQDVTLRDMFLKEYPLLEPASLMKFLTQGTLREDLQDIAHGIIDHAEQSDGTVDVLVFTNAFETRFSRAAVFLTACLDKMGHTVKQNQLFVDKNKRARANKQPAHFITTQEPASCEFTNWVVMHDRRKGVLIIMSWPYRNEVCA